MFKVCSSYFWMYASPYIYMLTHRNVVAMLLSGRDWMHGLILSAVTRANLIEGGLGWHIGASRDYHRVRASHGSCWRVLWICCTVNWKRRWKYFHNSQQGSEIHTWPYTTVGTTATDCTLMSKKYSKNRRQFYLVQN